MKVLIWIVCCALPILITWTFEDIGIYLGGTLYALLQTGAVCLALKLFKKWDWYRIKKKSAKAGMTVSEYARYGLTEKFLEKLDTLCKSVPIPKVKPLLKELKKQKKITKDQYIIFLEEYYSKR